MAAAREATAKVDPGTVNGTYVVDFEDMRLRFDRGEDVPLPMLGAMAYYYKSFKHRTRENHERVFRIIKRLSESGHPASMCELANLYRLGEGTPTNLVASFTWYGKAHALTNYYGTHGLALAYKNGAGVEADVPRAVELFKKAAEWGLGGAAYELGDIYERGLLGKVDIAEAIAWHRKSLQAPRNQFDHRAKSEEALKRLERRADQGR